MLWIRLNPKLVVLGNGHWAFGMKRNLSIERFWMMGRYLEIDLLDEVSLASQTLREQQQRTSPKAEGGIGVRNCLLSRARCTKLPRDRVDLL
jgi:hypothetical protein